VERRHEGYVKRFIYLTRNPFWLRGAGSWERAATLVRHLAERTRLSVVYAGPAGAISDEARRRKVIALPDFRADPARTQAMLRQLFSQVPVDACMFAEISLSPLLEAVPNGVKRFLDTMDVVHEQAETFRRLGLDPPKTLGQAEEFSIFQRFDLVLAIQEREQASVARAVGEERALLVPHPPPLRRRGMRAVPQTVAFVASAWRANVEALSWFLREVWPRVERPGLKFAVYGGVFRSYPEPVVPSVALRGIVPKLDDIYDSIDVAVNPVRCGAGLKIKSVEALGAGIPLVTTSEGARGLERAAGRAFLLADSAEDFAAALRRVLDDGALRERLSREGYAFAETTLSPDACFSGLVREIESPRRYLPGLVSSSLG
jgi:hypothetical protein